MRGSTYQIIRIVTSVKNAINKKSTINLEMMEYERNLLFRFNEKETEVSIQDWVYMMQKNGLTRLLIYIPTTNDRMLAGFANGQKEGIVSVYDNGRIACWTPQWTFDESNKKWNVVYTELPLAKMPDELHNTDDPTEEFMQILKSIGMLAMEIGYEGFYSLFNEAYMILNEEKPIEVSDLLIKTGLNDSAYRLIKNSVSFRRRRAV